MKAMDTIKEVARELKSRNIESPEHEAEILVREGLHMSRAELYRDNPVLDKSRIEHIEGMLRRRLKREPFQYITGTVEFLGQRLLVGPGVLIPRPETEFMAEQAIKTIRTQSTLQTTGGQAEHPPNNRRASRAPSKQPAGKQNTPKSFATGQAEQRERAMDYGLGTTVLDLCTGCGCLALALAKEFPEAQVYGTDISEPAIDYAKKNAEINGIKNVIFLTGSLFAPLEKLSNPRPELGSKAVDRQPLTFDLIISNPPYIRTADIKDLQPEIKNWEPAASLDGGADGLDFYRELIPSAGRFLKDEGLLMVETGAGQSHEVTDIMESSEYTQVESIQDYAGIERILLARWKR